MDSPKACLNVLARVLVERVRLVVSQVLRYRRIRQNHLHLDILRYLLLRLN